MDSKYKHIKAMSNEDKLRVLDDIITISERENIKGYDNYGKWIDNYLLWHSENGIDAYENYFEPDDSDDE